MSVIRAIQAILIKLNKIVENNLLDTFYPNHFILSFIFRHSKIPNLDDLYKSMTLIAYKTSNNFEISENLPYYLFANSIEYVKEIMEKENNSEGGKGSEDVKSDANKSVSGMMNSAKSSIPKMPNTKFGKF